jgi:hypothetical protein
MPFGIKRFLLAIGTEIRACVAVAVVAVFVSAIAPSAQRAAAEPDLSGLWLVQDPGSGSWSEWYNNVPKPALLPDIVADNRRLEADEAAGNVVNRMERRADCPIGNLPMMMASSPPLNISQGSGELHIGAESNRGRFIYTDGRKHPDTSDPSYVASGFGHSIGQWEAGVLVVDTVGFAPRVCDSRRPIMLVPGGGRAKETTHLVERFELVDGGTTLRVTFTWEDPTVYSRPHSYSYRYKKIEKGTPVENAG